MTVEIIANCVAYMVLGILVIAFTYVFGSMYLQLRKDRPLKEDK